MSSPVAKYGKPDLIPSTRFNPLRINCAVSVQVFFFQILAHRYNAQLHYIAPTVAVTVRPAHSSAYCRPTSRTTRTEQIIE